MSSRRIGFIVASHGDLAATLVQTTGLIVGHDTPFAPFAFLDGEAPKTSSARLGKLIRKCDAGAGVIILADLFGGTPGSLALSHLALESVEVITGVNLSMMVTAATLPPQLSLREAGARIAEAGQRSIQRGSAMLQS
jgi:PTS system mannose-specific IIA component